MVDGDSPYNYLSPEGRRSLEEAFDSTPAARTLFETGKVVEACKELRLSGYAGLAAQLDLWMPYKYSA